MPSPVPAAVIKAKTATLILAVALTSVLVCITYKRLVYAFGNSLILPVNLVVLTLFLLHRVASKDTVTRHAPLFSFPSLSQPLVSFGTISLSQPLLSCRSLSKPLFSLPSLVLRRKFDVPVPAKGFTLPAKPVVASQPEPEPVFTSPLLELKSDVFRRLEDNIAVSYEEPTKISDVEHSELEGIALNQLWQTSSLLFYVLLAGVLVLHNNM